MAKVNFGAIKMPFREQTYDEEGNPKRIKWKSCNCSSPQKRSS